MGLSKKRKEWARAYGSPERVRWVQGQWCVVPDCREWPTENAHTESGGMGRKADADTIVPVCRHHHREMHMGQKTFEKKYGLDLKELARQTQRRWQSCGGS